VLRVAAKAIIEAERSILILKPSANSKWHVPGGIRDDINEAIEETAHREVREEAGFDLVGRSGRVCMAGEWTAVDKGERVKIMAVFFHYRLSARPSVVLSHEHVAYAWVNRQNVADYDVTPEVLEIVANILD